MSIADVFNYMLGNIICFTKFSEDGTHVPQHVGVVKILTFMCVICELTWLDKCR
jgi:hypothetical protein